MRKAINQNRGEELFAARGTYLFTKPLDVRLDGPRRHPQPISDPNLGVHTQEHALNDLLFSWRESKSRDDRTPSIALDDSLRRLMIADECHIIRPPHGILLARA